MLHKQKLFERISPNLTSPKQLFLLLYLSLKVIFPVLRHGKHFLSFLIHLERNSHVLLVSTFQSTGRSKFKFHMLLLLPPRFRRQVILQEVFDQCNSALAKVTEYRPYLAQ